MKRTLRGAWSRRSTLLPLLLLTVVVTAGCVSVLGVAAAAGTSAALAVPLLVLGAVAVPTTGRELAAARRGEVAIARLRGLEGRSLHVLLALEPLLVLLLGGLAGWLLGTLGARVATTAWTDADPATYTLGGVVATLAVVVAGLVGVVAGMAGALREPLADQVTPAARPRRRGLVATFLDVLVVVGAVVAAYRASTVPADEPDWVVLAGPALLGLAVGQAAVLVVRLGARAVVARAGGSLAGYLAARRIARSADAGDALRVLVAAAVVAALAATGAAQVGDWTDETARLRAGAPVVVTQPEQDADGLLGLTRDLDPDGRWLMAAVVVPGGGSVPARRVFLDTERYDAVVGDFLADTPAAGVAGHVAELAGTSAGVVTGGTLVVTLRGVSPRTDGLLRPLVTLELRDASGEERFVPVFAEVPRDGSPVTVERPVTDCADGCLVERVVLDRTPGTSPLPYVLSGLRLRPPGPADAPEVDLLDGGWEPEGPDRFGRPGGALPVDLGLLARTADRPQVAVRTVEAPSTPVLATDTAVWPDGPPLLDSVGGDDRPAGVLERFPALPLVEADGLLADLPRAAVGSPPTVPAAEPMVLVRADAPGDLVETLADAEGAEVRTLAQVEEDVAAESGSAQALVYALVAGFALLVAVLVLVTAVARQRAGWLRDVAALRVVGLAPARLRAAGLAEAAWLAAAALVATVVGAALAARLLLAHLALVDVPEHAVPLTTGPALAPLVVAALVVAAVVLGVTGRGRTAPAAESRPAILREEATR
ncbi:FtsX-like permease family protein [Nocardioides sp. zg-579]|uniref:FtsX-like permease family protein n=1 Tax=Nocardioides marmotae TaxID=2663857 RepID=A0A6I3JDT9_9ACTN|nr:FtsX-like permease family protein [Nocardioides marmotae]MCR6032685.1 FtsX-like permease family protein [Gordonia jinghuaiqii]MTB96334.1 FtsX-like permease family protein [Nocardioides marmotae]QKE03182.1 FtsX-like permease family protein [Nocardioides marmotae]